MKNFNDVFKGVNLNDYAAVPFWSWNNKLDKNELIKQIHNMKDVGMGGFIMHARMGLTTEYLGEEWFECIEACLDEAKKLGMNGWIYDENGWPSGFVGGKLLSEKENLATYLEMEEGTFDENAFCSFKCEKGDFLRVYKDEGCKTYNIYLRYSPANTDILKPSVVTKFIEETYQKYYDRFADRFGRELTGFFTDEPQYFRWGTPYTVMLEEYFQAHHGEDVKDGLIHLFFNEERDFAFRVRYYAAMNELYTVNFYKRINDWCNDHGCLLTGHSVEESAHYTQMWGGAGCMPSYEHEGIPGIDNLGKCSTARISGRQIGSVAAQLGKKQILTETYGCSGYEVTPRQLRAIAEKQYVHGVNLMCHHLYSYSLSGQGKTDHPPCFSNHMTWNKDFKTFNDYFTRLGYLIANGSDTVKTAVLSPMTSIYLKYFRFAEQEAQKIDEEFSTFQKQFGAYNVEYHILDEKLLAKYGRIDGNTLVLGNCRYENVIIPYAPNVYAKTAEILKQYSASGGKLLVWKDAPKYVDGVPTDLSCLKSNTDFAAIKSACDVQLDGDGVEFTHRKIGDIEYVFMYNEEADQATVKIDPSFLSVDVLTGKASKTNGKVVINKECSAFLVKGLENGEEVPEITQESDITDKFTFVSASENNLTLDYVRMSKDGKTYSKPRYVYDVLYSLIKESYEGKLYLKYEFTVNDILPIKLLKETDKSYDITVNGNPVALAQSDFDVKFSECDLTPYLKKGVNEFAYCIDFYQAPIVRYALFDPDATESVRNCLVIDTEIEQLYLKGNFAVRDMAICAPEANAPIADVAKGGYPFFAGEVTYSAAINARAGKATDCLEGKYMSAVVTVNGKEYRTLLDNSVEVEVKEGENQITLSFTASLRNMIGPLHSIQNESHGVGPYNFRMHDIYGTPNEDRFVHEYQTVPFGITKVTVKQ